jgi:hypothetical protein
MAVHNMPHRSRPSEASARSSTNQMVPVMSEYLILCSYGNASWRVLLSTRQKWDAAPLFEMFSVTINELAPSRRQEPDAPPICLLACKAFLHHIVSWKNARTSGSGAACCDVSWKVNIAEWGLVTIAGMATHFVPRDGHRRCMGLP